MPTPSKRFLNWSGVSFTPSGGSLTAIDGVTSCEFNPGGQTLAFSGDANRYKTLIVNHMNEPSCTIHAANLTVLTGFAVGTTGVVNATLNDAVNGATVAGGAIKYALANAVLENNPSQAQHMQWGGGSLTFKAYSTDGSTSPLTYTAA